MTPLELYEISIEQIEAGAADPTDEAWQNQTFNPREDPICLIQAASGEAAVAFYEKQASSLDPDVLNPKREFKAVRLREFLHSKGPGKITIPEYLNLPTAGTERRLSKVDERLADLKGQQYQAPK